MKKGQDNHSRLTFLGSCSGTEPHPDRFHTSLVLEHEGKLFWIDAGECCSRNAYLSGLDLASTEAIFITHAHMDHTGGLPNLLWTMRKICRYEEAREKLNGRTIKLFVPDIGKWNKISSILDILDGRFAKSPFQIMAEPCRDGIIYEENGLRVTAHHNHHLSMESPWRSYSYRLETPANNIVCSGDVRSIEDLEPLLDGCDILLMETGHHKVETVCRYLAGRDFTARLIFYHHGRRILDDPAGEQEKARAILGNRVTIAEDGMTVPLG